MEIHLIYLLYACYVTENDTPFAQYHSDLDSVYIDFELALERVKFLVEHFNPPQGIFERFTLEGHTPDIVPKKWLTWQFDKKGVCTTTPRGKQTVYQMLEKN